MKDDKCPICGNFTREAFERAGGRFRDGTEIDPVCECDGEDEAE